MPDCEFHLPHRFDWRHWVDRYDRMQKRYLVHRDERFAAIVRIVRETQSAVGHVLDLGCGAGSLTQLVLEAFPKAQVCGVDLDPTILALARERLAGFGDRVRLIQADLRGDGWLDCVRAPVDAAISATALHWLSADQLDALYRQLSLVVRSGGVFLNADHVASEAQAVQAAWETERAQLRAQEGNAGSDSWDEFWAAYGEALRQDVRRIRESEVGRWEGVEAGLPLTWHLDRLRAHGFAAVDCFWRCASDAIYGGLRA